MKIAIVISSILVSLVACKPSNDKTAVTTEPDIITSADSSAIVAQPDSLTLDPETHETALQQDPPPTIAITPKKCDPNFTLIGNPKKAHHVYYISGFNPGEFKCWNQLEEHGSKICGERPCTIYYVDNAKVSLTSTAPHYIDVGALKQYGIGHFTHNGKFWEVYGAKQWKRIAKGYDYYNTNNHLGG